MSSLATKIMRRINGHGRGNWVCTPKDFLDLGNRAAVDRALSRLVEDRAFIGLLNLLGSLTQAESNPH